MMVGNSGTVNKIERRNCLPVCSIVTIGFWSSGKPSLKASLVIGMELSALRRVDVSVVIKPSKSE